MDIHLSNALQEYLKKKQIVEITVDSITARLC